jgi:hypothetical protein
MPDSCGRGRRSPVLRCRLEHHRRRFVSAIGIAMARNRRRAPGDGRAREGGRAGRTAKWKPRHARRTTTTSLPLFGRQCATWRFPPVSVHVLPRTTTVLPRRAKTPQKPLEMVRSLAIGASGVILNKTRGFIDFGNSRNSPVNRLIRSSKSCWEPTRHGVGLGIGNLRPVHHLQNRLARESLRRELCTGRNRSTAVYDADGRPVISFSALGKRVTSGLPP